MTPLELMQLQSEVLRRQHGVMWRRMRLIAGLTLRQAARALGVPVAFLKEVEAGRVETTKALRKDMNELYTVGSLTE